MDSRTFIRRSSLAAVQITVLPKLSFLELAIDKYLADIHVSVNPYEKVVCQIHGEPVESSKRKNVNLFTILIILILCNMTVVADQKHEGGNVMPDQKFWIGNFLADEGYWTTHVLMSEFISDSQREAIIQRCKEYGLNRIHIYGVNDDNYSERRGGDVWKGVTNRALEYCPEKFNHWFHWFVMCRGAGMHITLWLWPNDARQTYNNENIWDDDKVVAKMKQLIEFSKTPYKASDGTIDLLVDELVLKLEADDEWNSERINTIARRVRPLLHEKQTFWYHNQLISDARGVDWSLFDGIRIQTGHRRGIWEDDKGGWTEEGLKAAMREIIAQIPSFLLIYFGEFTLNGFRDSNLGTALLRDLPAEYPMRIWGCDNGGFQPVANENNHKIY